MKIIICGIFLLVSTYSFSQEVVKEIYDVPEDTKPSLSPTNPENNFLPPANSLESPVHNSPAFTQIHGQYYNPKLNFNSSTSILNRSFSYSLYGNYTDLKGIGRGYDAGAMLMYRPTDRLNFSFGAAAYKYGINGGSYNDFVYNASMTLTINEWMQLMVYGQYAVNSYSNSRAGGYVLSPQNEYGAILKVKAIDKKNYSIDMNFGIEREYNPLNRKWEMNYIVGPGIRLK